MRSPSSLIGFFAVVSGGVCCHLDTHGYAGTETSGLLAGDTSAAPTLEPDDTGGSTSSDPTAVSAETTSTAEQTGATSDSEPICGDGMVAGDEECDDGNQSDADDCDVQCRVRLLGFVTKLKYIPELVFVGLDEADARCQAEADSNGLTGVYRAWLSDAAESPKTRFCQTMLADVGRPILKPDKFNQPIATSWPSLLAGDVNPANLAFSADGFELDPGPVWTNTAINGETLGGDDCLGWSKGSTSGTIGWIADPEGWSYHGTQTCFTYARLYCFGQWSPSGCP